MLHPVSNTNIKVHIEKMIYGLTGLYNATNKYLNKRVKIDTLKWDCCSFYCVEICFVKIVLVQWSLYGQEYQVAQTYPVEMEKQSNPV